MKHFYPQILTLCALTSAPLCAAPVPASLIGQTVALSYDFSAEITQLTDDIPFGGVNPPIEPPSAAKTPYFGLSNGDVVGGLLTLDLTFGSRYNTANSVACQFGGYDCLYTDFFDFELLDFATGAAEFESTDFTSGTFLSFGTGLSGDIAAEWVGTNDFIIRNIQFDILDYSVAGLPALGVVPVPPSLVLLGGGVILLGAAGASRRRRKPR
ncbi:putative secreted protein with PEP-CTERM sorting signal [Litoreibacter meonggei]|uniref:Putative secreted protein with PEP-CTERM sorting signal n=1 Tax=Litoreibacter meonggei TaxID=1049199 RepID=A0A497X4R3_9RHOB|nr:hypothetical protein [Litoreibacter meonggei]RLJ60239.1 putative secreted protein with PEP-CTERM sorting signal [Litoreibacter meonggei]